MSRARTFADLATASDGNNLSNRNILINGDMAVHQRVATDTANDKAVDQIELVKNNLDTADFNVKHQSLGGVDPFANALEITCSTADTSIGANELIWLKKTVEAQFLQHLGYGSSYARTTTLSFRVKSNLTGTFAVALITNDSPSRIISGNYTIDSANTWEDKSITFIGDTDSSTVIVNDNGEGIRFAFVLAAGSNYTGTDNDTWANYADARLAHGHNVNIASSTSNELYITGIQWELGDVATPYKHESFADNLARCQRYFHKIITTSTHTRFMIGQATGAATAEHYYEHPVEMRAEPSLGQTGTAANYGLYHNNAVIACSSVPVIHADQTTKMGVVQTGTGGGQTQGEVTALLANNNANAYIEFSAEL